MEDLVTLNDDQEWLFRDTLVKELNWHRKKQLPLYIKSLDDLSNAISHGLTVEALHHVYSEQENGLRELGLKITPAMTRLFATMTDSQIAQLLKNLEQHNQDLEEEYVKKPDEERVKLRIERMVERIENWTGTLTDPQIQLISVWSQQIKPTSRQWIANRRAWQSKLGTVLSLYRHTPELTKHIENLIVYSNNAWPDDYRAAFEYNLNLTFTLLVNLEKHLSDRQRQHLAEEIAVLRKQLAELHNQQ